MKSPIQGPMEESKREGGWFEGGRRGGGGGGGAGFVGLLQHPRGRAS